MVNKAPGMEHALSYAISVNRISDGTVIRARMELAERAGLAQAPQSGIENFAEAFAD